MNAEKLLFRLLIYVALNIASYFLLFQKLLSFTFIQGYFILLICFLIIAFLERVLVGPDFYLQLPMGNILFCSLAIYIPVPFLYDNLLLKTLSLWKNDEAILLALFITNLGLQCILVGYNLAKLFPPFNSKFKLSISLNRIYPIFLVYFASLFLLIFTGNYGFTQHQDDSDISYVTILTNFSQVGIFGLVLLVLNNPSKKFIIFVLTAIMCFFGLLSGFKEAAMLPLIAVGVSLYFVDRKVPWRVVLVGSVSIVLVFSVVTSFRNAFTRNGPKELSSVDALASTYIKSAQEGSKSKYNYFRMSMTESILYRLNYAASIGKVIQYTQKKQFGLPYDSHPIHIIGSPIYFIIPRIIMPFKPLATFGNYITREVYGYRKAKYSIGVSQTGYAYLWNGIPGILLLMTFVGIFQGLLYRFFYQAFTPIYIFLFISNIYTFDEIWAYTATFLRLSLILLVAMLVLGYRTHASQSATQFNS